jgi:hypothetical protein
MPGRLWGLGGGGLLTAVIPLFLAGGGASVVFLVPLLALVLLPGGMVLGLVWERRGRQRTR